MTWAQDRVGEPVSHEVYSCPGTALPTCERSQQPAWDKQSSAEEDAETTPRLQMVWRLQEKPAQVLNMILHASLSAVRDSILGWMESWSKSVLLSFSSVHFLQTAKREDRFPGIRSAEQECSNNQSEKDKGVRA